ncbi:MAG TPA: hypothetical protein VN030_02430 [Cellvibrio sp.]|nr:hypothetical protein [Cellvibrio sp.]
MEQSLLEGGKNIKVNENSMPKEVLASDTDLLKAKWQRQIGNAKILWGRLTEIELQDSEGRADKLAGLVQERYALSRMEAEKQVDAFLRKVS